MKKIIMIPLLALGLIGCEENTTEGQVEDLNETNQSEEVQENNLQKQESEEVDLELYQDVVDDYASFMEMSREETEENSLEWVKG